MFGFRFTSSLGPIGIDISSRSVKLLQLRLSGGELSVVGAGEEIMPDDEELKEGGADLFVERIRSAISSGGFAGRRCIVSLPRTDVHMQSVRMPRMPDAELNQAAKWEASQRFSLDPNTTEVNVIRTGASIQGAEAREEVLLVAATHERLNAHLQPLLETGLRPAAVDTDFGALARFFSRRHRRESDKNVVRAVLEVGASGSTILILRGNEIAFCKTLAIAGEHFDRAVTEHLQMEPEAAVELRAARIAHVAQTSPSNDEAPVDAATDRAVFEAVRPLMGELAKELTLCLRYYGVTFRGKPPKQLILTGGDGLEPRLNEVLTKSCKVPVAYDDVDGCLHSLMPQIQRTMNRTTGPGARWAVAAGLSCRGLLLAETENPETETTTEASTAQAVAA